MDWLMKVFQNIETFPVPLMEYVQSREQKWYRVSTGVFTHFRKDPNCDICLTKNTRAPCRKRTGTVVLRAENRSSPHVDFESGSPAKSES